MERQFTFGIIAVCTAAFLLFTAYGFGAFTEPFKLFSADTSTENDMRFAWVRATSSVPWEPRDAHALVVHNGELFLLAGVNGNPVFKRGSEAYWNAPHFNDVWHSEDGAYWKQSTTTAPFTPRRSASVVSFNGALYMLGGWSPISGYSVGIWRSEDGFHWQQIEAAPAFGQREGQIVRTYKDRLWLFGGVNFDRRQTLNDVWVSSDGEHWARVSTTSPWTPRYDHDVVVHDGALWLLGGLYLGGEGVGDVWKSYDGAAWERVATTTPWGPRHGHTALSHEGRIWIISGWDTENDRGYRDTWYSADGASWTRASAESAPWVGREDHAAVVFKDTLWFTGGMETGLTWINDVWYADMHMPDASDAVQ